MIVHILRPNDTNTTMDCASFLKKTVSARPRKFSFARVKKHAFGATEITKIANQI